MVGDHIAGQPDAALRTAGLEVGEGRFATQLRGHPVGVQGVGGGLGLGVAAQLLDAARGCGALPDADQPQGVEPPAGQAVEFGIGNGVEGADRGGIALAKLVEPDGDRLGDQHRIGHPVGVGGKCRRALAGAGWRRHSGSRRPGAGAAQLPLLDGNGLGHLQGAQQFRRQPCAPGGNDEGDLAGQAVGGGPQRLAQQFQQVAPPRGDLGGVGKERGQSLQRRPPGAPGGEAAVIEQGTVWIQSRVVELDVEQEQLGGSAGPGRGGDGLRRPSAQGGCHHRRMRVGLMTAQQHFAQFVQALIASAGHEAAPPRAELPARQVLGRDGAQRRVEQGKEQQVAAAGAEPQAEAARRHQFQRRLGQLQQAGGGQAGTGLRVEQQALLREQRQGPTGRDRFGHGAAQRLLSGSMSRRKRAASSGGIRLMKKPLPHSKPAMRLRRGTSSMCQW